MDSAGRGGVRVRRVLLIVMAGALAVLFVRGAAGSLGIMILSDPVLVGAGDIAECPKGGAAATAKLLDQIDGTVFTAGDNAYETGKLAQFLRCYDRTWGRQKARTRPSPGNHDYMAPEAAPYFAYFGENAGPLGLGHYSYNLGAWHIISLNSNIDAGPQSKQVQWLRTDLEANPSTCTLAYWHHPIFSSGFHGSDPPKMKDVWRILYESKADVVVNGHDHDYERFALQNPEGQADPGRGIREFVVGTGGAIQRDFRNIHPNSEVFNTTTWGVLKLTLHSASYDWEFVPVAGKTFRDAGSARCVP